MTWTKMHSTSRGQTYTFWVSQKRGSKTKNISHELATTLGARNTKINITWVPSLTIRGMMAEPQSGATGGMKKKGKPDEKV